MKNDKWFSDRLFKVFQFLFVMGKEIVNGTANDLIPVWRYCVPGLFLAYALLFHLDVWLAIFFQTDWIEFTDLARHFLVPTFAASGWIVWSAQRAIQRMKLLGRLKSAFDYCGLKANGLYPGFIEDVPIDDEVRRLKLFLPGIPISKFNEAKESLQAHWNIHIVNMYTEENAKSLLNIIYATKELGGKFFLENPEQYVDGMIPIGKSYGGPISIRLQDMPHMLVAGQSGYGKSNFVKVMIRVLCENNPESDVYFLDFKNGSELTALKKYFDDRQSNFFYEESVPDALKYLANLSGIIDARFNDMKQVGASNFDEYLEKYVTHSATGSEVVMQDKLRRLYIVVDEAPEIYKTAIGESSVDRKKAREGLSRLARQGRAAGIHLVATAQKPDSKEIDPTVKANMPAILCFAVANVAASVAALGTKRAFEIGTEHKGRAIYKFGPSLTEVQTYYFDEN